MMSLEGVKLVKHFEGLQLKAYQDTAGIWTIGYGHTNNVYPNMIITESEATHYLYEDLLIAEQKVDRYLKRNIKIHEKDALISGAYNLTTKSIKRLIEYVNVDPNIYLDKIVLYCKDIQGHTLVGLKKRRLAERDLFLGKTWEEIKQDI